ncbi:MAG: hypothetical protein A3H24_03760 [Rhodoferax sp. RIFCSPLOWO2_12_FULL_60_11]|jgi:phospholipid transport system substrate-binding protein|nr:MAG: hypothetical protein A3H24_03760 [Rhodoferax sp. RIFCSPLOWO2_12_FULL_60_11]
MNRRFANRQLALFVLSSVGLLSMPVAAAEETPDALIRRLYAEVTQSIKADKAIQAGDVARIITLVDAVIMPNVDFQRMTTSAVGPAWRKATPEQQKKLKEEFKILLSRTYAGALTQVSDHVLVVKPTRMSPDDKEVVVRTEARGKGDPIQLDCRLERTRGEGAGWKIFNLNVMGVWLVEIYRSQFAQEINEQGIDGLINSLSERNKASATKS